MYGGLARRLRSRRRFRVVLCHEIGHQWRLLFSAPRLGGGRRPVGLVATQACARALAERDGEECRVPKHGAQVVRDKMRRCVEDDRLAEPLLSGRHGRQSAADFWQRWEAHGQIRDPRSDVARTTQTSIKAQCRLDTISRARSARCKPTWRPSPGSTIRRPHSAAAEREAAKTRCYLPAWACQDTTARTCRRAGSSRKPRARSIRTTWPSRRSRRNGDSYN